MDEKPMAGVVGEEGLSRRDVLHAGTSIALGAGAMPLLARDAGAQSQGRDVATLDRLTQAARDPRRRIVLKGATIITMDPAVRDLVRGDLLIEGKKISA